MRVTIKNVDRQTAHLIKNIKYATAQTINQVAFKAKSEAIPFYIEAELEVKKKNVSNAFLYTKAKKDHLKSKIYMKDDWHDMVLPQHFVGGDRERKGFERSMISEDNLSPTGISIQSIYVRSISKARYRKISNEVKSSAKSKYFVLESKQGDKPAGVYERFKTKVKLLTIFVPKPKYPKILDLAVPVSAVINREFDMNFDRNLRNALR